MTFSPRVPSGLQAVFSGPGQKPFIDLLWSPCQMSILPATTSIADEEGGRTYQAEYRTDQDSCLSR